MKRVVVPLLVVLVLSLYIISVDKADKSLEKAITFSVSDIEKWKDPHGMVFVTNMKDIIIEKYGEQAYELWLDNATSTVCIINTTKNIGVAKLNYSKYPGGPVCLEEPSIHETSILVIAMDKGGIKEVQGHTKKSLSELIKQDPDDNEYIGLREHAIIRSGINPREVWETEDNRSVSIRMLLDSAVTEWKKEQRNEELKPGELPSEKLLYLAPALIAFKEKQPDLFDRYNYQPELDRIFAFYEDIMVDGSYWGHRGETFVTGQIMKQYKMDKRTPPSLKPLEYMIEKQDENGKFDLNNHDYFYAQVKGMNGLHAWRDKMNEIKLFE